MTKDEIYKAAKEYSDSLDEFARFHTYPREAFRELTRNEIQEFEWLVDHKLDLICFHNHKEGDIYKFFLGKSIFGKRTWYKISYDRIQEMLIYSAPKH